MVFPNPPVLKTTIIQLNKELDSDDKNYEILTNEYTNNSNSVDIISSSSNSTTLSNNKKKRRRSSANVDSEELAKRKHETKQLHSIIEKRRRIKINREFEALKYLIPACRVSNSNQPNNIANKKQPSSQGNANGNKIDGMYKLTILKSSVEYILYLHHIIQKQHELLLNADNKTYNKFNIDFAKIQLDVNQYRNIDKEFSFKDLIEGTSSSSPPSSTEMSSERTFDYRTHSIEEEQEQEDEEGTSSSTSTSTTGTSAITSSTSNSNYTNISMSASSSISEVKKPQLPSPEFTPDIAPILTMLNKYQTSSSASQSPNLLSRKSSYSSPNMLAIKSNNPSPFTIPMKSTLSNSTFTSPSMMGNSSAKTNGFRLPDPAVEADSQLVPPRKMYFKSKNSSFVKEDSYEDKDQDASKTLLALRKSSIDSLLN